jgi:hypothetical protein
MKCSHRNPCTIDIARNIAHEKNGECLSEKYINSNLPLLWHCDKGHEWNACLHSVKIIILGVYIVQVIVYLDILLSLEMLEKLHIVEMGNVFLKDILISQQLYCGVVLKGMNGMQHLIALRMQIHGVLIVLDGMLVILIKPSKLHLAEMVSVYLPHILITIHIYYGNVLKDIYGMRHLVRLKIEVPSVHSALNI